MGGAVFPEEPGSRCPASFCTPRPKLPVTPGISWLPTFASLSSMMKRTSFHHLRPHYERGNGNRCQKDLCQRIQDCCIQCCWPTPPSEAPGHSRACPAQSLVRSWLLSPGSPCTQGFVCALQESRVCFPSPVEVLPSTPTGLQSQIPWGFSVPLPDLQVGKSVVSPGTFPSVWELLRIILLQSLAHLLSGFTVEIMPTSSKRFYATHRASEVCCRQSSCRSGRQLLPCTSAGDTQMLKGRSGSVSSVVPGSECSQVFVWAFQAVLVGMEFASKHDFTLPPSYWGFFLALGHSPSTGLEKVSFHSNPQKRQCQRMFKLPHNSTHLTH